MVDKVSKGEFTIQDIVKFYSSNPAERFGINHLMGSISLGLSANITILDMNKTHYYNSDQQFSHAKSSDVLYSGKKFNGKIDKTIEEFRFNVSIALFYETYNLFNKSLNLKITNDCLLTNMTKIMKLLIPFTPHLAYECLELLNCKDVDYWPKIRKNLQEKIKFAIQINGKTRDIISVKRDLEKDEINILVKNNLKISKFFSNKEILKTIFVKNNEKKYHNNINLFIHFK